ncbi:MFS transporter [Natronorubrum daqingense]|uniref:dolichyl-phosphooligosaccharide-protein glycotransferase n=1 Tax=Natronorubrum daqingense TaxID=588898 RepID=A0A1N7BSD8_9EURY|nr:MFS transporter [Natronorubrum daqingense]APX96580.1 MFS transporter [Natronorubrum daqingense]SIR54238.1 dolichyl-diphosphooligosaccharide--protein glycosyltransferase [Natronorubrum daqingense]
MTDDSSALADATASFLETYDEGERALEAVLEADAKRETWTFDDVGVDSGTFGELVSRGIVEKEAGEYRVGNPRVVEAVLAGEEVAADDRSKVTAVPSLERPHWAAPRAIAGVVGALIFLFATRIVGFRSVFRGDDVVLPENDPYYYRYWMEQLIAESSGPTDFGTIAEMPDRAAGTRPFSHAANWWFAELAGGDAWAAEMVAAWLPVAGALALGVVLYLLGVVMTGDVRVGIAAILMIALAPMHAVYTGVGFLEHRVHQYVWLGVTLLALAWLAVDLTNRRDRTDDSWTAVRSHLEQPWTWVAAVTLGVAIALTNLAWGGGTLHLIPLAGYIGLRAALDVRSSVSPLGANLPVVTGVGLATAISVGVHRRWEWHDSFVAYAPTLVLGGSIAVLLAGEVWYRRQWAGTRLVGVQVVVTVAGIELFRRFRPEDIVWVRERSQDLFARDSAATEAASLFAAEHAFLFGPLMQLGMGYYIALIVLAWAVWALSTRYEPAWLLLIVYAACWTVYAAFMMRFGAQLMVVLAVPAGMGLVYLLSVLDLARAPKPFRSDEGTGRRRNDVSEHSEATIELPSSPQIAAYTVAVVVVVSAFSFVYLPGFVGQVATDDEQYETAQAIASHANATPDQGHDEYVLSSWGDNRLYNYFVSGDSDRYGYASSNYEEFRTDGDPDGWYDEFDGEVGYVVMEGGGGNVESDDAQSQLHGGVTGGNAPSVDHYKAIYVHDDRSVSAFAVVPGATLEGSVEPDETLEVATDASVSGETLEYERDVTADDDGDFEVTVPYAGEYSVGDDTIDVTEEDVMNGSEVEAASR